MKSDEHFMHSALRLAQKGLGSVEPNPAVGCVIVRDGKIIGRGFHRRYGGPHAEIEALSDCTSVSPGETPYVTLETLLPPRQNRPVHEAIVVARIGRVVIAVIDPAEYVAGKGIDRLLQAR